LAIILYGESRRDMAESQVKGNNVYYFNV